MMKKWNGFRSVFKISLAVVGIVFLAIAGWFFYFYVLDTSTSVLLSESELKQTDFLQNKMAIVYFSTTSDQAMYGDGLSYATFIDEQGKAQSWKMHGLELGSMAVNQDQIFIEEGDKVRLVGRNYKVLPMKDEQHTGKRAGYLEKDRLFYSIYNTGNYGEGYYRSEVRWGNEQGFRTGLIPHYIETSGEDGEHVYILTINLEEEKSKFYLKEVDITEQKVEIKPLTEWERSEKVASLSSIFVDKDAFYIVLHGIESDCHVQLLKIDRKNYKRETYTLVQYPNDVEVPNLIPLEPGELYFFNKELYYVDGFGDVYTFNSITKRVQKRFSFLDYTPNGGGNNEHLSFRGPYVYFFHSQPNTEKYLIEKYNLLSGEREAIKEITGIQEIMTEVARRKKYAPIYDFKMLQNF
jgi:hypothetical protein